MVAIGLGDLLWCLPGQSEKACQIISKRPAQGLLHTRAKPIISCHVSDKVLATNEIIMGVFWEAVCEDEVQPADSPHASHDIDEQLLLAIWV